MTILSQMNDVQKLELAAANSGAALVPVQAASALVGSLGNGPGTMVPNAAGMDSARLEFGLAWLFRWLNGLKAGTAMTVGMIGDSNTESYRGPILQALLAQLPNVTVVNYGVGNTTLKQFVNKTGPYASNGKALDAVIAAGHDLIISNWDGTNTPAIDAGGSPQSFAADLDAMMTAIRGSANGSPGRCAVVLCTSSAQADGTVNAGTTWKRDMLFKAYSRPIVAAAAKAYGCAFFDLGARLPEATVDFAAGSVGVNTWLTDNRLHPINAHNDILAQILFEYLVPSVYRNASVRRDVTPGTSGFTQPGSVAPGNLENMSTKRIASHVYLEGRLNHAGLSIAQGQFLFAINSTHKPRIQVWNATIQLFDGATQPMTPLRVNIQADGQVLAAEAFSTFSVKSVRMRADWECVGY